ncbi:hypothetical protein [Thalassomonas sp. RHCl1]|uniref:hypothetical protein n=1 Tax=Thalassomonas sp. RHCl1 TaxID=2995320 RepID=UPI00248B8E2D|nr:hypothetical protein [Thalassomonas sp. RHCl1]
MEIAKTLEPQKNCSHDDNGLPSCYSTSNKILVVNSVTRAMYAFENGHDNQGLSDSDLVNYVQDIRAIPEAIKALANGVLNSYEAIHQVANELTAEINAVPQSYSHLLQSRQGRALADGSSSDCENSRVAKAVDTAFSLKSRSNVQYRAQQKFANHPAVKSGITSRTLNWRDFDAGIGTIAIGGSWLVEPKRLFIYDKFESDVPIDDSFSNRNQVVYRLSMSNSALVLDLSEGLTYFAGYNLSQLKKSVADAAKVSVCLGKTFDKTFPKMLIPSGTAPGEPQPRFGNIPIASRDRGADGQSCDHRYYRMGSLFATIAGSCE